MKLFICLLLTLSACSEGLAQTGRATGPGDGKLPPTGSARLYVTPRPLSDTSLGGLLKASDIVVDGTVESVLASRQPSPGSVETDMRILVASVVKGSVTTKEIMVSQTGGTIGALKVVPQQYDLMQLGERYLLFLTHDIRPSTPKVSGIPAYYVLGAWLGLVRVSNNKIHVSPGSPGLLQYDGSDVGVFENEAADKVKVLGLGR